MAHPLFQHKETVKVALIQPVLDDAVFFVFRFRMELRLLGADFP